MKKFKAAYRAGKAGRELEPDANRRYRVAHSLGRLTGTTYEATAHQPEITEAECLDIAANMAVGSNRIAFRIIKLSAAKQGPSNNEVVRREVSEDSGTYVWSVGFHAGERQDGNLMDLTPLTRLPSLMINRELLPVDNVTIRTETAVTEGMVAAPTTRLTVNARPQDPQKPAAVSAETLRIAIADDGTMIFERGNPNAGSTSADLTQVTVMQLLAEDLGSYQEIDVQESAVTGFLEDISALVKQA